MFSFFTAQYKCEHAKKSLKELSRHKIFIENALKYIPVPAPPPPFRTKVLRPSPPTARPPASARSTSPARPSSAERGAPPPTPPRVDHPHSAGGGRGKFGQVRGAGAKVEVEHLHAGEVDAVSAAQDDQHLTD